MITYQVFDIQRLGSVVLSNANGQRLQAFCYRRWLKHTNHPIANHTKRRVLIGVERGKGLLRLRREYIMLCLYARTRFLRNIEPSLEQALGLGDIRAENGTVRIRLTVQKVKV